MQKIIAGRNPQYLRSTDNRIAGALVGGYLRKIVQGSRHMLRSPRAWAIDAHALATARAAGQPAPGPAGKYGWCWRLPEPAWTWQDLPEVRSRTLRMF